MAGKTTFEFSAGGVVVEDNRLLVIRTRDLKGATVVTLPKGIVERGESSEAAALREVQEETGYRCEITAELPKVEYWYRRGAQLVHKTVRWFSMRQLERVHGHDEREVEACLWLPVQAAREALTYESDRRLIDSMSMDHSSEATE